MAVKDRPTAVKDRRIAVIGTALRFPGADSTEEYWRDIRAGVSRVRRFTDAEFAAAGVPESEYRAPGYVGASALLDSVDGFDAAFFGMSGREAALTDPQQRLFLECCFHALEDGGYARPDEAVRIGVYGSSGYRLYSLHSYLAENLAAESRSGDWMTAKQVQVGTYPDFTANRAAYRLGLTGPAVNVATACSSALVSVHLACQALWAGDADLMLVASSALHLPQITGHRPVKGSTLSPTGTVRAFDADADGTVGGNGVAAVLLKPLDRAVADGDTVRAVILGSAVTNDGADKAGFAAPGVAGQRDAVLGALRAAGVSAESIGYLEAHGTGTLKGDPIEFAALTEAFRRHTGRTGFCALGSTKPAIGHLDSAAGLAGLIKAIEVLRHGIVPPLVNFSRPNPALAVDDSPFVLPAQERDWPVSGVRRAGVHSIGMGGTNAHVILEQAPPRTERVPGASPRAEEVLGASPRAGRTVGAPPRAEHGPGADGVPVPALLPLSAASGDALVAYARSVRDHLVRHPETAPADLLVTTALGRRLLPHRLVVTSADPVAGLDAFLRDEAAGKAAGEAAGGASGAVADRASGEAYVTGVVDGEGAVGPVFLFSGQGGPRPGMCAELSGRFPVVAGTLALCARLYEEETGHRDFLARVVEGRGPARWDTAFAQPALFALQIAQARLWEQLGVTPGRVAGHSVGEYAALCVAGAMDVENAMRLVCRRGQLMRRDVAPGAMLAAFVTRDRVRDLLAGVHGLELAAVNGTAAHVLAGPPAAVAAARSLLADRGEAYEPLDLDRAFHTALLDPILDDLRILAERTELRPLRTEFVSGLDGAVRPVGWLPDADHLVRQARRTADFAAVLDTLGDAPVLLELGPSAVLAGMARRVLPDAVCVPTRQWERAVARLHCAGTGVDWSALLAGCGGRRVPLPTYPFRHQSYWSGPAPVRAAAIPHISTRSTEDGMTEQAVLERVLELAARHLGHRPSEVGADRSFVAMGADSLQLIGMIRQLEAEFGTEIAMREILEEAGTPRLTAGLIAGRTAQGPGRAQAEGRARAQERRRAQGRERAPEQVPMQRQAPEPERQPEAPGEPDGPVYATRAEVEELSRQIGQLAETQAAMLTQLSAAVALLTDRTEAADR
ncbi:acyltransferase domain-containing protein [Streptomyces sp. NBC_01433]|uniref:type I polyketide synthase n=1 Tax=Streptomyces sp. NBC_01433 TaxID=2903864 RepID=UPI00224DF72C|nr:beta-ketoacyl synthase N-terminal-like domain-containing protein [Streptomyces sp. NBC_01433]MCX4674583.1 acyltransferase domain-containing protein [Streptomyces sp. NBC_01433]